MKTCLDKKRDAANVLDNRQATAEEVICAKAILNERMCLGCSNPLTYQLDLGDLMCDKKE